MSRGVDGGRDRFARELQLAVSLAEIRDVYFGSVSEILGVDGVGYYRFRSESEHTPVEKAATLSESFIAEYENQGRQDDPVLDFVLEHKLPGDSSRIASERWRSSAARRVLAEEGIAHSMEAPITQAGMVVGTINFARAADAPAFATEDLRAARYVAEHLSLAMERARRFEVMGERASILEGALEQSPQGVVVTNLSGDTVFMNRRAKGLFNELGSDYGSKLWGLTNEVIADFIDQRRHAATVNIKEPLSGQRMIIKSYRVADKESVVNLLYDYPDGDDGALPAWDVLSPREQEIATMVSQGMTTREIAAEAFVSQNTVKQHLKRIFTKTDVHSRAELVQLIWSAHHMRVPELDVQLG